MDNGDLDSWDPTQTPSLAITVLNQLPHVHRVQHMSDGHLQAVVDWVLMMIFPHELLLINLTKQFCPSQLLHISPLRVFTCELTDDTSVQCDYYYSRHRKLRMH